MRLLESVSLCLAERLARRYGWCIIPRHEFKRYLRRRTTVFDTIIDLDEEIRHRHVKVVYPAPANFSFERMNVLEDAGSVAGALQVGGSYGRP